MNAAIIAAFVLTVLTVVVRFTVRIRSGSKPRLDDWLMLTSLGPLAAIFAINFVATHYGLGKHVWLATVGGMTKMEKFLFSSLVIYTFELAFIKVAVLCFYRRVFGVNWLNHVAMFFAVGWCIGSLIALFLAPVPISFFWTEFQDPTSGHNRYDFYNWYIGNAATNVVGDFLILIVPIPIVWGLKMRTAQKVMVSLVLFLGCFVFAASIVRIHYLTKVQGAGSVDITWTMAPVCLWSTIEPCLSIISASLPTIQPIVQWALKVEHNMYLRKHMPIKRSRASILGLRKSGSSIGTERTSVRGSPMRGLGKEDDDVIRLFTHAAHVEAGPMRAHRATNDLEEYLGTNYIRVQHDVHVSYDNSTSTLN
ncbi:hypothetical protein N7478_011421 [Penicillium angulare]|uniref:uncharacterized protein n=1 Tax=Penicillium angulare TaxID=116970 RepID=UPI002540D104|nr:uncharacterized protein N7478_011421 [Penicillium angulare]KAJ5263816.1 hypothetical protein N7478_011421 [Penicillium angulare]